MNLAEQYYVVVLQCHIVKEQCPGYLCEKAFHERSGGFADYPKDRAYRFLNLTCGGCCGQATHRKLGNLLRKLEKKEGIGRDRVVVQLSSCITKHNHHSPRCPHTDYLLQILRQLNLDCREDTVISELSERRRREGFYSSLTPQNARSVRACSPELGD